MPSVAIIGTRGYPSYYGGFETAVRKLSPYLADQGWDVAVYGRPGMTLPDDPSRDQRVRSIETRGIEKKSLSTVTYGYTAIRHAVRAKPDVALVMNVANGFWLPSLKKARIPTLVNVDGIEWDRAKWGRAAKWAFRVGARMTAKHADRLVYDSKAIARRWEQDFGTDGAFIPYGGDRPILQHPVENGLVKRGYIILIARFVPENTVGEFFESARALASRMDVVLVGSTGYGGELDRKAQELAETNQRIHWLGHVNDDSRLEGLIQNSAVYFHGHSVGGTNPILVQAMATGAPIVARDTVYNREVLGQNGIFTSPSSITATILDAIADRRTLDEQSKANIQRATTNYSWNSVNSRYRDELASLISKSNAG